MGTFSGNYHFDIVRTMPHIDERQAGAQKFSVRELEAALPTAYEAWREELESESLNGLPVADASATRLFQEVRRALLYSKHPEHHSQRG